MHFKLTQLDNKTDAELIKSFADLPEEITSLDLQDNYLGELATEVFIEALKKLSNKPKLTSINLSQNILHLNTAESLAAILKALPTTITKLNLSDLYLPRFNTLEELVIIFAAIPRQITSLTFSKNCLGKIATDILIASLKALPPGLRHFNLNSNKLYKKTAQELAAIFQTLSIDSLSLVSNDLKKRTKEEWTLIIKNIAASVTYLNLEDCLPNDLTALSSLPEGVQLLSLQGNNLKDKTSETIAEGLKFISKTIHFLDLSVINIDADQRLDIALEGLTETSLISFIEEVLKS